LRVVLACKMFFLILFNGQIAQAVQEAYDRVTGRVAAAKLTKGPIEPVSKKAAPTEVKAPDLGPVAAVLALLQREARFVDFLMEDVEAYTDGQIGAAARGVHRGCRKALKDYIEVTPLRSEKEGDRLTVEPGFDPSAIRLTGNLSGDPPFHGVLRHHGWKLVRANLPAPTPTQDASIVMPAEVEV
jgi:hypothetical protein